MVTLGESTADSVAPSLRLGGGNARLGNSDLDAFGEEGNIDSEVCYEDPLIYPLPDLALGGAECEIGEGVCKYSVSVLGTYFYIVKQRLGTRIQSLRYYTMSCGT